LKKETVLPGFDVTIDDGNWYAYKNLGKGAFNTGVRQVVRVLMEKECYRVPIQKQLHPGRVARGLVAEDGVTNMRKKRVYLEEVEAEYFRAIGRGKLSLGLRAAVAYYLNRFG
jgi:hypothetical protein